MKIDDLRLALEELVDPSCGMTLKESNGIKHIGYDEEKDVVTLIIGISEMIEPHETALKRSIARLVKIDFGFSGLKITMQESRVFDSIVAKKDVVYLGIISGKGGVGKSSVAANIAFRLMKKGHQVAIIDADIYGSSMPTILGVDHQRPYYNADKKIIPIKKDNIELISTEFFTDPSQPVIWRGAMLNSMINHFFYDVAWDNKTDYCIIDFPPGTGDIILDVNNILKDKPLYMLLVTTPHPSASHVAVKAGYAAQKINEKLLGVIENMAYYSNPVTGEREYIFGQGGGLQVAKDLDCEFIAQIEIAVPKDGTDIFALEEKNGEVYSEIADFIVQNTKQEK